MTEDRTTPTAELPLARPDTIRLALKAIWNPRNDTDAPRHRGGSPNSAADKRHQARVFALDRALEASEALYGC